MIRKSIICCGALLLLSAAAFGQADRHDVRAGNRKFRKGDFKAAEIDYRKAVLKDSASVTASYDLAGALYRQEAFEDAAKAMAPAAGAAADVPAVPDEALKPVRKAVDAAADVFYNQGDAALQQKDYAAAVEAFKQSLLRRPGDIDAKENYIYAKLMLQNQQNGGGGGQDNQDQDQNQDQNQDNQNDQDQNQDQNQNNQDQDQDNGQGQSGGDQPRETKISPQQAQQMLQAIQAKEKETQDKVNKEKAAVLKSRQKEKNW